MSDINLHDAPNEELETLAYARKNWFPKPVAPATIYRWVKHGSSGVRLQVLFSTGQTMTTKAACKNFLANVDRARRSRMVAAATIDATPEQLQAVGL